MKKKLGLSLLLIVLLVSLAACGQKAEKEIELSRLLAFEEGNYWKYNGYGNEFASLERKVLYKEGQKVQIMESTPGTTMGVVYELSDQKAIVIYSQEDFYDEAISLLDLDSNRDQIILQAPIKEKESWNSDGIKYTVLSLKEEVDTDAGLFENCVSVKVEYPGNPDHLMIYYKPDLGMVKQEYISGETEGEKYVVTTLLAEYQVKGFN